MRVFAEIEICEACLTIADGDPSMGDDRTQADCAAAARGIAENWGAGYHIHGACPGDCDGTFSHSACEGCGQPDAGARHPAVVLVDGE